MPNGFEHRNNTPLSNSAILVWQTYTHTNFFN
jgi:hypothetical protein